jgi:hypothetical protein
MRRILSTSRSFRSCGATRPPAKSRPNGRARRSTISPHSACAVGRTTRSPCGFGSCGKTLRLRRRLHRPGRGPRRAASDARQTDCFGAGDSGARRGGVRSRGPHPAHSPSGRTGVLPDPYAATFSPGEKGTSPQFGGELLDLLARLLELLERRCIGDAEVRPLAEGGSVHDGHALRVQKLGDEILVGFNHLA